MAVSMKEDKIRKRLKSTICLLGVLVASGSLSNPCFAFEDEDLQSWNSVGLTFDINKDWKFTFEEEFRLGHDAGNFYNHTSDIGFVYKSLADWIDLGFNFREVFEKDSEGEWRSENRPHFNATLKAKVFGLDLSDRSRFEYRDRETKKDVWRYRNKFTIKFPIKLTALELQPYVADEVFINIDEGDFHKNRLYSGFSFKLAKNLDATIFYLWQSSESSSGWKDINVVGTGLKYRF